MRVSPATRWAEGLVAGLAIGLSGVLRPGDPAFAGLGFLPQALVSVLVSSLLGIGPGAAALAGSVIASLALPPAARALGLALAAQSAAGLLESARLPAAATLAAVVAAGWARDASERARSRLLLRIRELTRRGVKLRKVNEALSSVCDELERRVSGQRDSISALYAHMRKMDSHDLGLVLDALLEAVRTFSQAQAAAVYEYDQAAGALSLAAHIGPRPPGELPLGGSVEGWAFRNDTVFSLRMLDERPYLAHLGMAPSVLAFPLRAGDLPWGLLAINEMPFYRYNPVTEKNLGILVELSSQTIKKAVEFRERDRALPKDLVTGLPGYEELALALGESLKRRAPRRLSVSLVVLELLGFDALDPERGKPLALELLKRLSDSVGRRDSTYHFRSEGQLAFLLPGVDRDGASIFCLDLAKRVEGRELTIDGARARLEPVFGIGSFPGSAQGSSPGTKSAATLAAEMVSEAEAILSLSRSAYAERGEAAR